MSTKRFNKALTMKMASVRNPFYLNDKEQKYFFGTPVNHEGVPNHEIEYPDLSQYF